MWGRTAGPSITTRCRPTRSDGLALALWMKDGGFERHLRRMTRIYEKRFMLMQEELEKLKTHHDISYRVPNGGMSFWVNLNASSRQVAAEAARREIFFQEESSVDYHKKDGTHFRIGFAGVNENEIRTGLNILGQILKRF